MTLLLPDFLYPLQQNRLTHPYLSTLTGENNPRIIYLQAKWCGEICTFVL
jgi:hypothetical protein